jgi:hypothetical protein
MNLEDKAALIKLLLVDERPWDAIVAIGRWVLDSYYPEEIFTGVSGDPGPQYIVALREALRRIDEAQHADPGTG